MTATASVLVDVREELGGLGRRRGIGESHRLVHLVGHGLLHDLHVGLGKGTVLHAALGEYHDRVALLLPLHLFLRPVHGSRRVAHGVSAEAIGARLDEGGDLVAAGTLHRATYTLADGQHVHPVHRLAVDAVGLGEAPDLRLGEGAGDGRAHRVAVVLADEDHGQLPEGGEVERLVELALGHRAVSEVAEYDLVATLVLDGESRPGGQGQVRAHDTVAAQEVDALVEEVHRAALALGKPVPAAEEFGHHAPGIGALGDAVAVLAVGRDHVVLRAYHRGGTYCHRLLADVEVEKPADLAQSVHLGGLFLEASEQLHLVQQPPGQPRVEPGAGYRGFGLRHDATPA